MESTLWQNTKSLCNTGTLLLLLLLLLLYGKVNFVKNTTINYG